ncbi:hypothetical protein U9M48_042529 [Paspalum notatum var. saurae]|uniref:Uncharacterized protein n=1 Tax=Paspalum notatum var. saurae TaxID=547442 RepID=A0AAQ3UT15_PASNO
MLAVEDPLRATPAPPLHLNRVPLALAQLWSPTEVPPTSFLAGIGSPRRRHTDTAAPRFTAAAPPLCSSPRAEIRGKRLSVDGNTVRHRLGSKSGSRAAGATRRPLPRARRPRKKKERPIRDQKASAWNYIKYRCPKDQLRPTHDLESPSVVFGRRSCPRDQGVAWGKASQPGKLTVA